MQDPGGPYPHLPVIGIASSAGGMAALFAVLGGLPAQLPAAVVVVQHLAPQHRSVLPELLSRKTELTVHGAHEGDLLQPGHAWVAPPDRHVLVNPDLTLSLSTSPPVHFLRPSADLLFSSLARSCGEHAVAVVLTGTGNDGTMGAHDVKAAGGTVIAQDEQTSEFFGMPSAAINAGVVEVVLPLGAIAPHLAALVSARGRR